MPQQINFSSLKGKTAVVTGGAGVIGSSLCRGLAQVGAKIAIMSRREEATSKLAGELRKEFGVEAIGVSCDVTVKESIQHAKKVVNESLGSINCLINCAGGNKPGATSQLETLTDNSEDLLEKSFFGLDIEQVKGAFDLNFAGTFLPTMIFAKDMVEKKSGTILNVSSMAAQRPLTKVVAYSAAKSAIDNFTEWLSVHFAKVGVRVNAIAPGFFLTEQNRFLLTEEATGNLTPRGNKIIANTPMGRFGETDELIGASLFLLSDLSGFITGVTLPIDGGFNAFSGV